MRQPTLTLPSRSRQIHELRVDNASGRGKPRGLCRALGEMTGHRKLLFSKHEKLHSAEGGEELSLKRGQPTIRHISDLSDVIKLLAISVRRDVCSPVYDSKSTRNWPVAEALAVGFGCEYDWTQSERRNRRLAEESQFLIFSIL
jgi:hypothetical protein